MACEMESGVQVLSRNTGKERPSIAELNKDIFPDPDLFPGIIELSGEQNCGKSFLIYQLLMSALLPKELGGCECSVILVDTESKFIMQRFVYMFQKYVDIQDPKYVNMITKCLENLQILKCFSYDQFDLTLEKLPEMISSNSKVSLIAIDSIASFYWFESDIKFGSIENFMKNYVKKFQSFVDEYQVSVIYTRPTHFKTANPTKGDLKELPLNYEIQLDKIGQNSNVMKVTFNQEKFCKIYRILSTGFVFIKSSADEKDFEELEEKLSQQEIFSFDSGTST